MEGGSRGLKRRECGRNTSGWPPVSLNAGFVQDVSPSHPKYNKCRQIMCISYVVIRFKISTHGHNVDFINQPRLCCVWFSWGHGYLTQHRLKRTVDRTESVTLTHAEFTNFKHRHLAATSLARADHAGQRFRPRTRRNSLSFWVSRNKNRTVQTQ